MYQSFSFFLGYQNLTQEKMTTERKKFHVTQHVGRFWRESKFVKLYAFGVACNPVIFILLYLCCVCGVEICVCLLCLIFVNSFMKTHITTVDESWQLYRGNKKSWRIMNLWTGKKCVEKITLGHCRKQRHKHGATNKSHDDKKQ